MEFPLAINIIGSCTSSILLQYPTPRCFAQIWNNKQYNNNGTPSFSYWVNYEAYLNSDLCNSMCLQYVVEISLDESFDNIDMSCNTILPL